jgi:3-isopropylmalate dehydrogenase
MRQLFDEIAHRHPDIEAERLYIDAGAMMFVTEPERFDVVVTENVFGDIVSEIGAGIVGGLGFAPSADVGKKMAVFQPSHGSAPTLAGRDSANPVATMLSAVMLLEWLGERHGDPRCLSAAAGLRDGIEAVVASGPRTVDAGGRARMSDVTRAVLASLHGERAVA